MKVSRFSYLLVNLIIFLSYGCGRDKDILPDVNNSQQFCFTIKDANTNFSIQGATLELKQYFYPDCFYCPYSSKKEVSDVNGKACMDLVEGWWCESYEVTASGYQPKFFDGKPPVEIYLTPIPN